MIAYQREGSDVKTLYRVEYVDNPKDWAYICGGSYRKGEPHEYYKTAEYNDLGEALTFYLVKFFCMCGTEKAGNAAVYDVKLFEQVVVDGEVVRESWIEPLSTVLHSLHTTFGVEHTAELYRLRKNIKEQEAVLKQYEAFIRSVHAEDHFKKFISHG